MLVKITRLIMRIARAPPFSETLALKADSRDEGDFFWPGDADPDKVCEH